MNVYAPIDLHQKQIIGTNQVTKLDGNFDPNMSQFPNKRFNISQWGHFESLLFG